LKRKGTSKNHRFNDGDDVDADDRVFRCPVATEIE
jgi:hypothetical protein